jgi:hypothetical protein
MDGLVKVKLKQCDGVVSLPMPMMNHHANNHPNTLIDPLAAEGDIDTPTMAMSITNNSMPTPCHIIFCVCIDPPKSQSSLDQPLLPLKSHNEEVSHVSWAWA